MTIVINKEKAIYLMEQAVAEKGTDYSASAPCFYTEDGITGSCIVGKALELAGANLSSILNTAYNETRIESVDWDQFNVEIDLDAQYVFSIAQDEQDAARSWGHALNEAKRD